MPMLISLARPICEDSQSLSLFSLTSNGRSIAFAVAATGMKVAGLLGVTYSLPLFELKPNTGTVLKELNTLLSNSLQSHKV
jgi:hypothetical protein